MQSLKIFEKSIGKAMYKLKVFVLQLNFSKEAKWAIIHKFISNTVQNKSRKIK